MSAYAEQLHEKIQILKKFSPVQYSSHINAITALLQGCIDEKSLFLGREIHCLIIQQGLESNTFLGSYLIRLFSVCGRLLEAGLVFNKLHDPNVFAWSEIVSSQSSHGEDKVAIKLFEQMVQASVQPDGHVYVAALTACARAETLFHGKKVHFHIIGSTYETNVFVSNALINLYVKCGALEDASIVFNKLTQRDVVSWSTIIAGYAQHLCCLGAVDLFDAMQREGIVANNVAWNAIICGYVQNGDCQEALGFFHRMLQSKRKPDNFTYVSVLNACSGIAAIDLGRLIHADIIEAGYGSDLYVRSILIDMYAKCGSLDDVFKVFCGEKTQNTVTWTAMMAAYALQNDYKMVLQYFRGMQQEGCTPNDVTFVCLLSACSHMGLVEDAFKHFNAMRQQYGITPTQEHYNCLLDLLGRVGLFNEVNELLGRMPDGVNIVGWTSLLNSCKIFGNLDLGRNCLQVVANLELRNASSFMLMARLFGNAAMWDDVKELVEQRKSLNAWKKPAIACIEVEQKVHTFTLADKSNPHVATIYGRLDQLRCQTREEGYLPELERVMSSMVEDLAEHVTLAQPAS
eukprot:c24790_g7_i1 orf=935-2650(+)